MTRKPLGRWPRGGSHAEGKAMSTNIIVYSVTICHSFITLFTDIPVSSNVHPYWLPRER